MEKLKIVIILLGLIWFSGCGYIKQTNIESKDIGGGYGGLHSRLLRCWATGRR